MKIYIYICIIENIYIIIYIKKIIWIKNGSHLEFIITNIITIGGDNDTKRTRKSIIKNVPVATNKIQMNIMQKILELIMLTK